jgi:hypothetical protein
VLQQLPAGDPRAATLRDAHEAPWHSAAKHFCTSFRATGRLTKPSGDADRVTPVRRVTQIVISLEPETLEIAVDVGQ